MYIDFAIIKTDISDIELKETVKEISSLGVINSITSFPYHIRPIKSLVDTKAITLSCLIDYPLGACDLKTRLSSIEQASKSGASSVDIVIPQHLATNRKYEKIREDTKACCDLALSLSLEIRYIVEYRIFDHSCLKKICEIIENNNIKFIYPSTGYFLDNLADNILASIFLYKNSKDLNVLCTGNIWLDKHFDTIKKSGLFGFRTTSIHSLKNYISSNLGNSLK